MKRKTPERSCIACKLKTNKAILARIVKTKDSEIFYDKTGKKSGRGAYICKNINCLEKAIKFNLLSKSLNCQIEENIYQQLREVFTNEE